MCRWFCPVFSGKTADTQTPLVSLCMDFMLYASTNLIRQGDDTRQTGVTVKNVECLQIYYALLEANMKGDKFW